MFRISRLPHFTHALMNKSKARACGYVHLSKRGKERVLIGEFTNALLDAKGISLDADTGAAGRRGRELSYKARVQKNGVIILSACYMKEMGLEPGQEFEIKMGRKSIKLTAIEPETEKGFDESSDEDEEFDDDEIE
jgi:hypothetical protein